MFRTFTITVLAGLALAACSHGNPGDVSPTTTDGAFASPNAVVHSGLRQPRGLRGPRSMRSMGSVPALSPPAPPASGGTDLPVSAGSPPGAPSTPGAAAAPAGSSSGSSANAAAIAGLNVAHQAGAVNLGSSRFSYRGTNRAIVVSPPNNAANNPGGPATPTPLVIYDPVTQTWSFH